MGTYTCRLVTSWIMFSLALSALVIAMLLEGWGLYTNKVTDINHEFGLFRKTYYEYNFNVNVEVYTLGAAFSTAIFAVTIVAILLCAICVLLSFIMMCADCCCRVTQCMAVIPKITMAFALIAGLLAECGCVLFLIDIYAVDPPNKKFDIAIFTDIGYVLPYYCFYIVMAMGILLMVAGCTNFGARHASKVGVEDQRAIAISVVGSQSQSQSQSATAINPYAHPNNMQMSGYFAPPAAMPGQFQGYQATTMGFFPPNMGYYGPRLVVTNMSTQTSSTDIHKAVKYEGGKGPKKK
ncbi:unnamed protein product [Lymnaea stagnalis]|uniref:Uncharacterized protein n=1 Tax=Lymnaea stagnalis TaxID=6523 RepID=A0AAV2HEH3_LYMST